MRAALTTTADDRYPSGTRAVAASAAASASSSGPPSSDSMGGRRTSGTVRLDAPTVLLVDDDMTVLSGFRRCLQAEDLTIEFALSGGQALRRLLSEKPPDVVVCDMLLPDISGVDVYQRAIAADPSYRQRFAVATGASNIPFVATFLASFGGPVLYKPVEPAQLILAVRTCLSGARIFLKSSART
jgi:DNA-binding NarL/FixJ family response regulator